MFTFDHYRCKWTPTLKTRHALPVVSSRDPISAEKWCVSVTTAVAAGPFSIQLGQCAPINTYPGTQRAPISLQQPMSFRWVVTQFVWSKCFRYSTRSYNKTLNREKKEYGFPEGVWLTVYLKLHFKLIIKHFT